MGVIMPLTAFLITRFPTKKLYLSGILCFILGLLLSIFAGNFGLMMVGRVFQACGNGIIMAAAQVVILTVYPPENRGTMMGTYGLATTAAPIIAPTIAGLMIDAFGWKSIFYLALGIMAVSLVFSALVFEDVLELQDKKFDFLSFVESLLAFGGITLGVGNIGSFGLLSIPAGLPLLIGLVACVFFVLRQCRLEQPFLDMRILANRSYAVSVVSSMVLYLVMMGSSVLLPLYVQRHPPDFHPGVRHPGGEQCRDVLPHPEHPALGCRCPECLPQPLHRQLDDAAADLLPHHCRSHGLGHLCGDYERRGGGLRRRLWGPGPAARHECLLFLDGGRGFAAVFHRPFGNAKPHPPRGEKMTPL